MITGSIRLQLLTIEHRYSSSSGSREGDDVAMPPNSVKISDKKLASKGGRIDIIFLAHPPPPNPAAGSATVKSVSSNTSSAVL